MEQGGKKMAAYEDIPIYNYLALLVSILTQKTPEQSFKALGCYMPQTKNNGVPEEATTDMIVLPER